MLAETEAEAEAEAALPNDLKNQSRARTDDDARHLCALLLLLLLAVSLCCCCSFCQVFSIPGSVHGVLD